MAQEAEAARREKAAAAARKIASGDKPAHRRPAAKPAARVKIVWLVCDQTGAAVATHAWREEQAARRDAERRTRDTGKTHFVTKGEVPLE